RSTAASVPSWTRCRQRSCAGASRKRSPHTSTRNSGSGCGKLRGWRRSQSTCWRAAGAREKRSRFGLCAPRTWPRGLDAEAEPGAPTEGERADPDSPPLTHLRRLGFIGRAVEDLAAVVVQTPPSWSRTGGKSGASATDLPSPPALELTTRFVVDSS